MYTAIHAYGNSVDEMTDKLLVRKQSKNVSFYIKILPKIISYYKYYNDIHM